MAKKARNKSKSFISALSKQRPNRKNRKRSIKQQDLIKRTKSLVFRLIILLVASYTFHHFWSEFVSYTIKANTKDYITLVNKPIDEHDINAKNDFSNQYFSSNRDSLKTILKRIQNKYGYSLVHLFITQNKKVNLLLERHKPIFKISEKNNTCLSNKAILYQGCQNTDLPLLSGIFFQKKNMIPDESGNYLMIDSQVNVANNALKLETLIKSLPEIDISKVIYNEFDGFRLDSTNNLQVLFGHDDFENKVARLRKTLIKNKALLENSKIDLDYNGKLFFSKSNNQKEKL